MKCVLTPLILSTMAPSALSFTTGAAAPSNPSPFWQIWCFIGFLIIGISALVAGGFRLRLNAIREQNVYLEAQVSDRTSELRDTNSLLEKEIEHRKRAEAKLAKRAAEELQQSEERFRAMFEHSAVGIGVMGLDGKSYRCQPCHLPYLWQNA